MCWSRQDRSDCLVRGDGAVQSSSASPMCQLQQDIQRQLLEEQERQEKQRQHELQLQRELEEEHKELELLCEQSQHAPQDVSIGTNQSVFEGGSGMARDPAVAETDREENNLKLADGGRAQGIQEQDGRFCDLVC